MIDGFWNTTQHYRRAYALTLSDNDWEALYAEHRLQLDAIERCDLSHAEQLLRFHIRRIRIRLPEHPALFYSGS